MDNVAEMLRLLGDGTRLRILNLLGRSPLNVSELTAVLGLAQSGVSRHLSQLRKAGVLRERREGVWSYYEPAEPGGEDPGLARLLEFLAERLAEQGDPHHDLPRLHEVLRRREDGGPGINERLLEPGQSWLAHSRLLAWLLPAMDVADLGCGDGALTLELARFAGTVVGVDRDPARLEQAARRAERQRAENARWVLGDLQALDLPSAAFDAAFLTQCLHHLPDPGRGLAEAARLLRPGGRAVVAELAPHGEEWVREKLGHRWLGFEPDRLGEMMAEAGLTGVRVEAHPVQRGETFRVIQAVGRR